MNNTEKDAGIGGLLGAGLGGLLGAASHSRNGAITGAVAGGLIGTGVGALAGSEKDQQEKDKKEIRQAAADAMAALPPPPSLQEIIRMTQQGVADETIITLVRQSRAVYRLTPDEISMLKDNRVSDRVVQELINTPSRVAVVPPPYPRTVVVQEPGPTVIYARPYYYGPPGVYIRGGYYR